MFRFTHFQTQDPTNLEPLTDEHNLPNLPVTYDTISPIYLTYLN
jgi:hypothetical protein